MKSPISPYKKTAFFDFYKIPTEQPEIIVPTVSIPVNAGFPSPAEQYIEETIDLAKTLIKKPSSTYILRVKGSSMVDVGIFDGSVLIVDASLKPSTKDIAVCIIDGEFTLKRISKVGNKVYLMPENKNFKPIEVTEGSSLEVWAIVTWTLNQPNHKRNNVCFM